MNDLPSTDIRAFTISPDDPNRLYAFVVGQGIFMSADGGRTWRLPTAELLGDITGLAAAGGNPETLYAGSTRFGVLRSTDSGRNWKPANMPGPVAGGILALAVDVSARQTVYASGEDGLYKSTNSGATWNPISFPDANVVALSVSPPQPNIVLALTVQGQFGVIYRSEDGGQSWR